MERKSILREVNRVKEEIINANLPALEGLPNKGRERIVEWLAIKAQEPTLTTKDIAVRMGIAPATLYTLISRATREGWLKFDDPINRLEHEIIPKVMDNLSEFMDQKDKTATLEIAKGTIFKTYQLDKGVSDQPVTVLALKIESIPSDQVKVITGHIVGKPKVIEGVIDETIP